MIDKGPPAEADGPLCKEEAHGHRGHVGDVQSG